MKAIWNNTVLAESDKAIRIDEDYFFPVESVAIAMDHLKKAGKNEFCDLKGNTCYYDVIADGKTLKEAAISYENPPQEAYEYRNMIGFTKNIEFKES